MVKTARKCLRMSAVNINNEDCSDRDNIYCRNDCMHALEGDTLLWKTQLWGWRAIGEYRETQGNGERVFTSVSDKHANAGVTPSSIYHQGKNKGKISKKELIGELRDLKIIPVYPPSQSGSAPHSRLRAILDPLEKHW